MASETDIAAAYDDLNTRFQTPFLDDMATKPIDLAWTERLVERCRGGRLLDVGCGTGKIARFAHDRGVEAVGVDISPVAVEQARAISPGVGFDVMSALALEYPDGSFDGVSSFFSIIHLARRDAQLAVAEMARVLKPGGHLLLTAYAGEGVIEYRKQSGSPIDVDSTLFTIDELSAWCSSAGLPVVEARERGPYKHEFVCQRLLLFACKDQLATD